MDDSDAIEALTALAQPTRLQVFRHLVAQHPQRLPAGEIARRFEAPHNTMSTHLAVLTRAGLLSVLREGRSMLYRADLDGFRALAEFLIRDCCEGKPDLCLPLLERIADDCSCPETL
jgi:DNA-binding transcriptional ArsR family regulator